VGSGEYDAAIGTVCDHKITDETPTVAVESGQRFVKQPKRARRGHQAGERNATLLPGGKILRRYIADFQKTAPLERFVNAAAQPEVPLVKFEMFGGCKLRLDCVLVTHPADERPPFFTGGERAAVVQLENNASRYGVEQTCNCAQERRLAGSVPAADREAAAGSDPKIDATLHHALAADEHDVLNLQF
jgi:hypothetical protein